jgi:ATP phosphoribosyltransferase regulatory subunit
MVNQWFRSAREQAVFRRVEQTLLTTFAASGYQEVDVPLLETSRSGDREAFHILGPSNEVVSLRPDFTRAIAEWATTGGEQRWQRCSYLGDVFRRAQSGSGGLQVLCQAGVECLGAPSPWADVELIALAVDSLLALRLDQPRLVIGHSGLLRGLLQEAQVEPTLTLRLLQALARRDLVQYRLLLQPLGERAQRLLPLGELFGGPALLPKLETLSGDVTRTAWEELRVIIESLTELGYAEYLLINPALTNPWDYYSGTIFEGYVAGAGGPVLVGGRYDGLLRNLEVDLSASGFAVMVDRLLPLVADGVESAGLDFLLLPEPGAEREALRTAMQIRRKGFSAEICWDQADEGRTRANRRLSIGQGGVADVI